MSVTGTDYVRRRRRARPNGSSPTRRRRAVRVTSSSAPAPSLVTVSGDGVHKLETRAHRRHRRQIGLAHAVRAHRHRHADRRRPTPTRRLARSSSLDVDGRRHGRALRRRARRVEAQTAPPAAFIGRSHVVTVASDGINTLETRVVDSAGNDSGWKPHTVRLDLTIRREPDAEAAPTGGTRIRTRVTLERQRRRLQDPASCAGSDRGERHRVRGHHGDPGDDRHRPACTRSTPGPSTWRATSPPSGGDGQDRPGKAGRRHGLSGRSDSARAQDHVRSHRRRFGRRRDGVESQRRGKDRRIGGVRQGRDVHARATSVRDNAGNVTDSTRIITVTTATEDTTAPVDNTAAPKDWQRGPYDLVVTAEDAGTEVEKVEWRGAQDGSGPVGQHRALRERRGARDRDAGDRLGRKRVRVATPRGQGRPDEPAGRDRAPHGVGQYTYRHPERQRRHVQGRDDRVQGERRS